MTYKIPPRMQGNDYMELREDLYLKWKANSIVNGQLMDEDNKVIKNSAMLAVNLKVDVCMWDEVSQWLDKYLVYRKWCNFMGWNERNDIVWNESLENPEDWGFTKKDYFDNVEKFTEVMKPICKGWDKWVQ